MTEEKYYAKLFELNSVEQRQDRIERLQNRDVLDSFGRPCLLTPAERKRIYCSYHNRWKMEDVFEASLDPEDRLLNAIFKTRERRGEYQIRDISFDRELLFEGKAEQVVSLLSRQLSHIEWCRKTENSFAQHCRFVQAVIINTSDEQEYVSSLTPTRFAVSRLSNGIEFFTQCQRVASCRHKACPPNDNSFSLTTEQERALTKILPSLKDKWSTDKQDQRGWYFFRERSFDFSPRMTNEEREEHHKKIFASTRKLIESTLIDRNYILESEVESQRHKHLEYCVTLPIKDCIFDFDINY